MINTEIDTRVKINVRPEAELVWVTAPEEFCSGGDCLEIAAIGGDWFRMRSNNLKPATIAVNGAELRAFIAAVRAGAFDEVAAPLRSA